MFIAAADTAGFAGLLPTITVYSEALSNNVTRRHSNPNCSGLRRHDTPTSALNGTLREHHGTIEQVVTWTKGQKRCRCYDPVGSALADGEDTVVSTLYDAYNAAQRVQRDLPRLRSTVIAGTSSSSPLAAIESIVRLEALHVTINELATRPGRGRDAAVAMAATLADTLADMPTKDMLVAEVRTGMTVGRFACGADDTTALVVIVGGLCANSDLIAAHRMWGLDTAAPDLTVVRIPVWALRYVMTSASASSLCVDIVIHEPAPPVLDVAVKLVDYTTNGPLATLTGAIEAATALLAASQ